MLYLRPMETFDVSEMGDMEVETLVGADDYDGNAKVLNEKLAPGVDGELHVHENSADIAIVLSGSGHVQIKRPDADEPESTPISAGTVVYIPEGEPHLLTNEGDEPVQFILVQAPPDRTPQGSPGSKY